MTEVVICDELALAARQNSALRPLLQAASDMIGAAFSAFQDIHGCNVGSQGEKDTASILTNVQEMAAEELAKFKTRKSDLQIEWEKCKTPEDMDAFMNKNFTQSEGKIGETIFRTSPASKH